MQLSWGLLGLEGVLPHQGQAELARAPVSWGGDMPRIGLLSPWAGLKEQHAASPRDQEDTQAALCVPTGSLEAVLSGEEPWQAVASGHSGV